MPVQRCSDIHNSFATLHKMAEVEIAHFKGRTIRGIACGTLCALQLRISAFVLGTFWAAKEVLQIVPRLTYTAITVLQQGPKKESISQSVCKAIQLWSNVSKTQMLQGLGLIA